MKFFTDERKQQAYDYIKAKRRLHTSWEYITKQLNKMFQSNYSISCFKNLYSRMNKNVSSETHNPTLEERVTQLEERIKHLEDMINENKDNRNN